MTNILNLDAVTPKEKKSITWKGVKHEYVSMTVGTFIDQMKRIEDTSPDAKGTDHVLHSLEMIVAQYPTMTVEMLREMNKDQLEALKAFINGETIKEAVRGAAEATGTPVNEDEPGN